ncbi:hypothetical protein [Lysinibacillus fusiformis]|uniref:hypothetical protein n=1 Tax=Lysinibacillus fusiformis TaxID=28031 RepID=UPI00263AB6AD|nr:hypothetical protein [Lysinibacillus fusiformis]MDC6267217.1 hypothetical protein [Lysinibacillus sphaericus]MDN4968349.1 hypothetical protein [Lysinibacillus fusiformis]MDN4968523.1 hypothetical protein [Lysinibacillus fusiformis]
MKKSRKERKLEAKQNGVTFEPQYNGKGVISFEEHSGLGIERFNNKFVQFSKPSELPNEVSEGTLIDNNDVVALSDDILIANERTNDEMIEAELALDTPKKKKKKSKFKKVLKKLFNK